MAMKRMKDGMGRMGPESAEIEFTLPEGVVLDGERGEAVISWEKTENGSIRIVAIEGQPVSQGTEEPEETAPEEAIDSIGEPEEMA